MGCFGNVFSAWLTINTGGDCWHVILLGNIVLIQRCNHCVFETHCWQCEWLRVGTRVRTRWCCTGIKRSMADDANTVALWLVRVAQRTELWATTDASVLGYTSWCDLDGNAAATRWYRLRWGKSLLIALTAIPNPISDGFCAALLSSLLSSRDTEL